MQVHDLESGRVITLDKSEQFAFNPPADQSPGDATRVSTVTVFRPQPDQPAYFTVAGEQLVPPAHGDPFWEVPTHFTDSGPLPPHVRAQVEDLVPVVDRPAEIIGNDYAEKVTQPDGTVTQFPSPTAADRQVQRRAVFDQLDSQGQEDLLARRRPSDEGAWERQPWESRHRPSAGGHRGTEEHRLPPGQGKSPLLQVQPLNPGRQVPQALPPSAFLNTAQVREGR